MRKRKTAWGGLLRGLLLPAFAVGVLVFFSTALNSLDSGRDAEGLRQLEDTLRRSCVACYAAEGSYPASLSELEERYGLRIDRTRFTVHYRGVAENLMPEITVLENEP